MVLCAPAAASGRGQLGSFYIRLSDGCLAFFAQFCTLDRSIVVDAGYAFGCADLPLNPAMCVGFWCWCWCLREQVFAAIEVPPVRQTLFLRGAQLSGASTLRAASVKAGDTLHLKVQFGAAQRGKSSVVEERAQGGDSIG